MFLILRKAAIPGILAMLLATACPAQTTAEVDPSADHVLQRLSETLKAAGTMSFHNEAMIDDMTESGQIIQLSQSIDVVVRRPDGLWAEMSGDMGRRRVWFDGSKFTLLDPDKLFFAQLEVGGSIEEALDQMMSEYGVLMPLAELAFSDPYRTLIEKVQTGSHLGLSYVGGVECHHLAFTQETIDWQIWVATGYPVVPHKVVITYKQEPGSPQYIAQLSGWDLGAPVTDVLFRFEPPLGTKEIEFMPSAELEVE